MYQKIMQYIYLHGFSSSPQSYKAQYLLNCFRQKELNLQVLDLNQNDFTNLTLTRQIDQTVANFSNSDTPITLIGSSFGGVTRVIAVILYQMYLTEEQLQ